MCCSIKNPATDFCSVGSHLLGIAFVIKHYFYKATSFRRIGTSSCHFCWPPGSSGCWACRRERRRPSARCRRRFRTTFRWRRRKRWWRRERPCSTAAASALTSCEMCLVRIWALVQLGWFPVAGWGYIFHKLSHSCPQPQTQNISFTKSKWVIFHPRQGLTKCLLWSNDNPVLNWIYL